MDKVGPEVAARIITDADAWVEERRRERMADKEMSKKFLWTFALGVGVGIVLASAWYTG